MTKVEARMEASRRWGDDRHHGAVWLRQKSTPHRFVVGRQVIPVGAQVPEPMEILGSSSESWDDAFHNALLRGHPARIVEPPP